MNRWPERIRPSIERLSDYLGIVEGHERLARDSLLNDPCQKDSRRNQARPQVNRQNGQFAQIRKLTEMLEGTMTKQDWAYVEEALKKQFRIVVLICDGYRLSLTLNRIGNMELAICTYINGEMKGCWLLDDCEERRRFMRPIVEYAMSAKDRKSWVKDFGKRWLKAHNIDVDKTYTNYYPWWKSFRSLKAHLIKNNTSIELATEAL